MHGDGAGTVHHQVAALQGEAGATGGGDMQGARRGQFHGRLGAGGTLAGKGPATGREHAHGLHRVQARATGHAGIAVLATGQHHMPGTAPLQRLPGHHGQAGVAVQPEHGLFCMRHGAAGGPTLTTCAGLCVVLPGHAGARDPLQARQARAVLRRSVAGHADRPVGGRHRVPGPGQG
ncbi:hypothetical protein G6F35_015769 [Rhizopus arrhizus]|nr:hypothetical protein G6F35_015769 [Rhizopus arrhizus]